MANIRKSFNFRSGLQVDNDSFYVNPNGLVGIGTSIPTEAIDAIGNAKISGLTTTTNLGVAETANFYGDLKVGNINLDATSGIVTAVSFYGDGSTLSNVFAISTTGWVAQGVGLHTVSRSVGIGTTNPVYKLQIGLDPVTGVGVGITNGNIIVSGIITATTFVGNVTGIATTAINLSNAANITTGTISNDRLPSNINKPTGIITASSFVGTASTATFASTSGIASTATKLETARNFSISGDLEASTISFDGTGDVSFASTLSNSFNANTLGIITANQIYSSNTLYGVDLSLSGADSSIEVNGSNSASISIGNTEVDIGNSYASFSYSNNSLNISNFDIGDINSYLQVGTTGLTTGRFNWYDGDTGILLMALTHQGRLGIGRTDPVETFEVVGTSTVTTDSYVGNNLYVGNDLNVTGSISGNFTLPDPITSNVNTTSGISTFGEIHVFGGVTSKIGIGTDSPDVGLDARDHTAKFNTVAINTTSTNYDLNVGGSGNFLLNVRSDGGFYSGESDPVEIYVDGSNLIFNVVGIGSTSLTLS